MERWKELLAAAQDAAKRARELSEKADAEGRAFTEHERAQFDNLYGESTAKAAQADQAKADAARLSAVTSLTNAEADLANTGQGPAGGQLPGKRGHLGLSGKAASAFAGEVAQKMMPQNVHGKALTGAGDVTVDVPVIEPVQAQGKPTSFLDVLPMTPRSPVYRYLRQTVRTNNAAPVAAGGLKPTSTYTTETILAELTVIAHISEAVDHYLLSDNASLQQFVASELIYGLRVALEDQVLNGDGIAPNFTGMRNTSGIQTEPAGPDRVTTLRSAATKLENMGFETSLYIMHPSDWEAVETTRNTGGNFDLNGPVDRAERRVWGVQVALTNAIAPEFAVALDASTVSIDSDEGLNVQWSNSTADDFSRNQVRARCEGRFGLSVFQPAGIVDVTLVSQV